MVYLLNMVIFHGYISHNQMVQISDLDFGVPILRQPQHEMTTRIHLLLTPGREPAGTIGDEQLFTFLHWPPLRGGEWLDFYPKCLFKITYYNQEFNI